MRKFFVLFFIPAILVLSSCGLRPSFATFKIAPPPAEPLMGCMQNFADNFNIEAAQEDGSCVFSRCLDASQDNFSDEHIDEINAYITKHKLNPANTLLSNCDGRSGCTHNLSSNRDLKATKENGACLFNACLDDNYHEYMSSDAQVIGEYIQLWGESYHGQDRVTSTCKNKKQYCQHPQAYNYTGPDIGKGEPYCIFYACTREKYEGYSSYLAFQEFLKNYPGEIIVDNSDTRCGPKLVSKNVKEFDVDRENLKTPVDVAFIVDDSRSMDDEIKKVRDSLINLAPVLQNFNADINLEIHKLDNVNANTRSTVITNTNISHVTRTEYLRPIPVQNIKITANASLADIENGISKGMDLVQATYGNGEEQGACYTQRILESFKTSSSKNLVTVLLTDEDDNFKGSSKNCDIYADYDSRRLPPYDWNHVTYKDKSGKDDLINVITEGVIDLNADKKFGFISIDWNKFTSTCVSAQGSHAENYVRLINQLTQNGKKALEGDICQSSYDQLLDETLASTLREIIGFKYDIASLDKNPIVEKVELVQNNNQVVELGTGDYQLSSSQGRLYLEIDPKMVDQLRKTKKLRLTIIEDQ